MTARVLAPTGQNVARCAQALLAGDLVAMPTETVYGLAGHALEPAALARIFATKERPTFDPLILHVALDLARPRLQQLAHLVDIERLSSHAQAQVERLLQAFWPGPLTLVLPRSSAVPDLATSGLPTVAVRMPRHPVALALIRAAGVPLAAPSANRFGRISPTHPDHVLAELGERIAWVLDGGPCEIGVESTVLAVSGRGELTLLRPGGLARTDLESVAGPVVAPGQAQPSEQVRLSEQGLLSESVRDAGMAAPGMLESHYAPRKPLTLLDSSVATLEPHTWQALAIPPSVRHLGLLLQSGDAQAGAARLQDHTGLHVTAISLSPDGDPADIARHLFAGLRALDASEAEWLLAEPCTQTVGLGHAIADRLRRASHGTRQP